MYLAPARHRLGRTSSIETPPNTLSQVFQTERGELRVLMHDFFAETAPKPPGWTERSETAELREGRVSGGGGGLREEEPYGGHDDEADLEVLRVCGVED